MHRNQGHLVASNHCVPHCHFENSVSRLQAKKNIYETQLRQSLCDNAFGWQSVKHNLQWLFRTNSHLGLMCVFTTRLNRLLNVSLTLTDTEENAFYSLQTSVMKKFRMNWGQTEVDYLMSCCTAGWKQLFLMWWQIEAWTKWQKENDR